jgi:hypothetical protein
MAAPPRRAIRRLLSLDSRELRDLFSAQYALLKSAWRVRRVPVGTLVVRDQPETALESGARERATAIALAIGRAAEHGLFRPYCLVRAIALHDLLRSNGIHGSAVRVGVRRERGRFAAHAWIVWRGEILGDLPENVARFTEVDDLRVVAQR